MTEVLKAATDADFLAMVPMLAGYSARNSIVCAVFHGKRTGAAFRFDLPARHRHSDYRAVADAVGAMALRVDGADRLAPVLYTDQSFDGEHGIPWRDFAQLLDRRLMRLGFGVMGPYCVAADGWGSYDEAGSPRYPLDEIESSPLYKPMPALSAALPDADPAVLAALGSVKALPDAVEHVEQCLSVEPSAHDLAVLAALAQAPYLRDAMMVQIAFGRIVGEALVRDSQEYHVLQDESGLSMDEVVLREIEEGRLEFHDELTGLLLGVGRIRPDTDRVQSACNWLAVTTASVPEPLRPPLLCMLGWLHWTRGLGTIAGAHIDSALDIDPDYGMAELQFEVLRRGVVPEWALPQ